MAAFIDILNLSTHIIAEINRFLFSNRRRGIAGFAL